MFLVKEGFCLNVHGQFRNQKGLKE